MHDKNYDDSKGTFKEPDEQLYTCRKCGKKTARRREWESSCGGYEDDKYTCTDPACRYVWWVEGPDA